MPPADFLAVFRDYYGPTMNAFEAAEASGRADDLLRELEALFNGAEPELGQPRDVDPRDLPARHRRTLNRAERRPP